MSVGQISKVDVLWLDDMISSLGTLRQRLSSKGVKTDTSSSSPTEYGHPCISKFSNVILDSKFSNDNWHEGRDLAHQLLKQEHKRVIVFSGFIDAQRRYEKIEINHETSSAILYIPKVAGWENPIDEYVEDASACMANFFRSEFKNLKDLEIPDFEQEFAQVRPLGYREFLSLSLKEKKSVYEEFKKGLGKPPQEFFKNGAVWVFYAGNSQEPFKVAYEKSEILYPREVNEICDELDCPAFIFRNDIKVNTTGCATEALNMDTGDHISSYPVAGVSFVSALNEPVDFREMHFDTGADYSFLCSDFASESGITGEMISHLGEIELHGRVHMCDLFELQVLLRGGKSETSGETARIAHDMQTVFIDGWSDGGLIVKCSDVCGNQTAGQACQFRKIGLLGRTCYISPKNPESVRYSVHIDGTSSRAHFLT